MKISLLLNICLIISNCLDGQEASNRNITSSHKEDAPPITFFPNLDRQPVYEPITKFVRNYRFDNFDSNWVSNKLDAKNQFYQKETNDPYLFLVYNDSNKLVECSTFNKDSILSNRELFFYDSIGRVISKLSQNWSNNDWKDSLRNDYIYNENPLYLKEVIFKRGFEQGIFYTSMTKITEWNQLGRPIKFFGSHGNVSYGFKEEFELDSLGRVKEVLYYFDGNIPHRKTVYYLNSFGNPDSTESFFLDYYDDILIQSSKSISTYNINNQLVNKLIFIFVPDSNRFILKSRSEYNSWKENYMFNYESYQNTNHLASEINTTQYDANGLVEYNESVNSIFLTNGSSVVEKSSLVTGTIIQATKETNIYDNKGFLTQHELSEMQVNSWVPTYCRNYETEYDTNNQLVSYNVLGCHNELLGRREFRQKKIPEIVEVEAITKFNYFPNPTQGILNLTFEKDVVENDLDLEIDITDICGRTVYFVTDYKASSNQIDISAIGNGIYFLKVYSQGKLLGFSKILKL